MITKLDDLLELVKTKGKIRLVAAYANDSHTVCAVSAAVDKGIVDATLVGDIDTIKKICADEGINPDKFELVQEADETKAGTKAVSLIREGKIGSIAGKPQLIREGVFNDVDLAYMTHLTSIFWEMSFSSVSISCSSCGFWYAQIGEKGRSSNSSGCGKMSVRASMPRASQTSFCCSSYSATTLSLV